MTFTLCQSIPTVATERYKCETDAVSSHFGGLGENRLFTTAPVREGDSGAGS